MKKYGRTWTKLNDKGWLPEVDRENWWVVVRVGDDTILHDYMAGLVILIDGEGTEWGDCC